MLVSQNTRTHTPGDGIWVAGDSDDGGVCPGHDKCSSGVLGDDGQPLLKLALQLQSPLVRRLVLINLPLLLPLVLMAAAAPTLGLLPAKLLLLLLPLALLFLLFLDQCQPRHGLLDFPPLPLLLLLSTAPLLLFLSPRLFFLPTPLLHRIHTQREMFGLH